MPDLAEELVCFLENLPTTIRTEVFLFVLIYAYDDTSLTEPDTFLPKIKEVLLGASGKKRMGATIRTIGALDYILQRAVTKLTELPYATAILAKKRTDLADRIFARQPLALKHHESALSSWQKLRTHVLNHANLSRYEDALLMPPRS